MESNIFLFQLSEFLKLTQKDEDHSNPDYKELLKLNTYPHRIVSIFVMKEKSEIASVVWGWANDELRLGKVEVVEEYRRNNFGTRLMTMVIEIAKHYRASRITGTAAGDDFLIRWYQNLGFKVLNGNQIILELSP